MSMQNSSLVGGMEYFFKNSYYTIPYLAIYSFITLNGFLGNALIVLSITTVKGMITPANLFMLNLAVSDLLISVFVDSAAIAGILVGSDYFEHSVHLCGVISALCFLFCATAISNLGMLAFNRYIQICHQHLYKKIFSWRKTAGLCASTWLVGLLFYLPHVLGLGGFGFDRKSLSCYWNRLANFSYTLVTIIACILIPIICIFACYMRIFVYVVSAKKKLKNISKRKTVEIKLAKSLFITYLLYSVTWIPYSLVITYDKDDTLPSWLHSFVTVILHSNSSFNPIVYAALNSIYSNAFKVVLNKLTLNRCFPNINNSRYQQTVSVNAIAVRSTINASP